MYTHAHRNMHAHKFARGHMLVPMTNKTVAWRYLKEARRTKERERKQKAKLWLNSGRHKTMNPTHTEASPRTTTSALCTQVLGHNTTDTKTHF